MDFCHNAFSLLFSMLSRLVRAFLPRSKCLWISWLQSLSAVILEPKKIKSVPVCFHFFPFYLPWSHGTRCHDLNFFFLMLILSQVFHSLSLSSRDSFLFILCHSVQFSSFTQSCPTLCDPMNHSTPGLPVHHQLPEFTQTHVRRVSDAIQPSHPLSSPSPPTPNPSQYQSLFQWVNSLHEVAKVLEFQL